ncbi:MAG: inosine-5-monophosphate dehydrogenase [Alphaproteobacteria bacterium 64-6]|jgi:CBS domain-containing protein|uniref:CBS domain-containing protein n=1 Tax=Hyphomicrobium sp. CS1BSMeth3 TaxID=1892844 RepID=UPI00086AB054|nr:CBS domain-containing protein [Hyphomicrobium sp. CS1BSMeth3]MBN9264530.1 CBS domain-containing protein [Hyphomicrobium sp.]ODT30767.1 MAG: inosine-5-monophosphate dehydrogenase [Hyphomicrobium sp. SCN 65-11]OJU23722.1 MAG: inosine-5-monophosphate dehydrogenase [Alphaproteobacteria bacterium 64-6]
MHVASILKVKGHAVETVRADVKLTAVASRLTDKRIGAVVVTDRTGGIAGIVSERDIVHALAREGAECLEWSVSEIMTREVLTCSEDDTIDEIMSRMTMRRCRHLPVVSSGRLAGIISIGDVVKHHIAEVEMEAMAMRDYIATA